MEYFLFGQTENGLGIPAFRAGRSGPEILIVGGVHGDEPEGPIAALGLLHKFAAGFPFKLQLTLVPQLNLDGLLMGQRKNSRGVDLNRNLPTQDWTAKVAKEKYFPGTEANSESENKALVSFIKSSSLQFIISLHSWKPMINTNGDCDRVASTLHRLTGYKVTDDIGYPTPGSLGTFTGLERQIPTITYEIERFMDSKAIIATHVPALWESLKTMERFL